MYKLQPGEEVISNQAYQEKFGRTIIGKVVELPKQFPEALRKAATYVPVVWTKQSGKTILENQGQMVLMLRSDLEKYNGPLN
ncbi:hypothetical protein SFC65_18995 [Priestia filamentosa]|uniref:hypothetical protein n=1 Tax=Priestia filamentosa TaxID=1402861 RepID=UPI0039826E21